MIDSDWLVEQYPARYAHLPLFLVVGTFEPGQLGKAHWNLFLCSKPEPLPLQQTLALSGSLTCVVTLQRARRGSATTASQLSKHPICPRKWARWMEVETTSKPRA